MIKILTAALLASAIAVPAQAADFLKYTFNVTGTAGYIKNNYDTADTRITGPLTSQYVYYLPLASVLTTPTGQTYQYYPFIGTPGYGYSGQSTIAVTDATLSVTANFYNNIAKESLAANLSVCGAFGGAFPTASFTTDPACSSATSTFGMSTGYGGLAQSFTGVVTSVDVMQGFGAPPSFGLAMVPSIPEPGTWALMLLGFASIGAALRRSRQRFTSVLA